MTHHLHLVQLSWNNKNIKRVMVKVLEQKVNLNKKAVLIKTNTKECVKQ